VTPAEQQAELERVTLFVLAVVEETSTAEQRRRAVTGRVERALRDPGIATAVDAIMACRAARQERSNLVVLAGRKRRRP
jgi:predicted phosphoribosyltransferase